MVRTRSSTKRVEVPEVNSDKDIVWFTPPVYSPKYHNKAKTCPMAASKRPPLKYARRASCSRNKSTEATFTVKKQTQYAKLAYNSHLGVQPSDNLQNVDIHLCQGVDPSLSEFEPNDKISVKESIITQNTVSDKPQSPSQAHSIATSLNLSNMLFMDDEFSSIDSKKIDALEEVAGYRVKQDLAPILGGIISKYGDIGVNCKKSNAFRSLLLETVCNIVKKLEVTEFVCLKPVEVESFRGLLEDMKSDLNVGWLIERLNEINEAKRLLKESPMVKEAKRRNRQAAKLKEVEIKAYEKEICKLQEKIKFAKVEMELRRAEKRKCGNLISHTKDQLKKYNCGKLTDGLF